MSNIDEIHSCSYYCDRPGCIKAQRDELRDKYEEAVNKQRAEGLIKVRDSAYAYGYATGAEAEREACAKLCETLGVHPALNVFNGGPEWYRHGKDCAKAIRARGE